jgi:hypothetical protein
MQSYKFTFCFVWKLNLVLRYNRRAYVRGVFENRALRRMFKLKVRQWGTTIRQLMKSVIVCAVH